MRIRWRERSRASCCSALSFRSAGTGTRRATGFPRRVITHSSPSSTDRTLVEVTYRTIQGRFLLRPDRELNELVVGVLARAQSFCNAELIGIVVLSNHIHLLLSVPNQWHLSTLMQYFGGNAAREVNRFQDWRGSLWERRYTGIYVTEEPTAQIERLSYLLAQELKEDLVERVEHWPGIHLDEEVPEPVLQVPGTCFGRFHIMAASTEME